MFLGIFIEKNVKIRMVKSIDLQEEIYQAKQGETLKVYKVTKDSIYIQFYNHNNK